MRTENPNTAKTARKQKAADIQRFPRKEVRRAEELKKEIEPFVKRRVFVEYTTAGQWEPACLFD
jgi:hypothetical protein